MGNKTRPEGSIVKSYIDNEWHTFCSMYFLGADTRFTRPDRNYEGGREMRVALTFTVFSQIVRPIGSQGATIYVEESLKEFDGMS